MQFARGQRFRLIRLVGLVSPEVRNAGLVLVIALIAALLRAPAVAITTTLIGLLLAAWAVRRRGAEAAGPMFFYDLVRLARRGRSTLLRCTYALLLLMGLYGVYCSRFPLEAEFHNLFHMQPKIKLHELAYFAGTFATAIFALQSAAVIVLTPAYVSGAITEEKERRTLEMLFTTHLTDREIVLGKLFGRLMHLCGVVLAGLPILMAVQVWGGVEPLLPIAGLFVTLLTLLSVGAICIYCSVVFKDSFTALVVSYLVVVPVAAIGAFVPGCFFSSPVAFMMSLEMQLGAGEFYRMIWPIQSPDLTLARPPTGSALVVITVTFVYAVPHFLIAIFCMWNAVRGLRGDPERRPTGRIVGGWDPTKEEPNERQERPVGSLIQESGWEPLVELFEEMPVRTGEATSDRKSVLVTDSPLLWKEVYHQAGEWTHLGFFRIYLPSLAVLLLLALIGIPFLGLAEWEKDLSQSYLARVSHFVAEAVNPTIRIFGIGLTVAWCVASAWRTASSVTREREARTLGALLSLPGDRSAILRAKWWGGILRVRWLGIVLLAFWTVGVLCGALHPAAVVLLAIAVAAHLAFLASLGLNLSLISRNTLWANFNMSLMLLLMFAGAWVGIAYYEVLFVPASPAAPTWWHHFSAVGLNPLRTWWYLGFNWEKFPQEAFGPEGGWRGMLGATLAGVGAYAAAAGLLWLEARREFRKLDAA